MKDSDTLALVPRRPGALAKASPATGRILSGVVADTLVLAKQQYPQRRGFRVLSCSGDIEWAEMMQTVIQGCLGGEFAVEVTDRHREEEIERLLGKHPFDLVVAIVNNIRPLKSWGSGESRVQKAGEFLVRMKAHFGIPVVVGCTFRPQSFDLPTLLKQGGIDAFVALPSAGWTPDKWQSAYHSALDVALRTQRPLQRAARPVQTRPRRIIIANDEPSVLDAQRLLMQFLWGNVEILTFTNGEDALRELEREAPDLFITDDTMPRMTGRELCQRLLSRNISYPIIVNSPCEPTGEWVREFAGLGLRASYLPAPFGVTDLRNELENAGLAIPLQARP